MGAPAFSGLTVSTRASLCGSLVVIALAALAAAPGCGGSANTGLVGDGTLDAATKTDGVATEPTPLDGGDGSTPCSGLECDKPQCKEGTSTRVTGKVYDPAGANPLYNVLVYIPSGPLAALPSGASCDPCGAPISPTPIAMTRTDAKGEFVLDDVPIGKDVPIVVQTGKWRRTIPTDITEPCDENRASDRSLRLPKNGTEGDMPHLAVTAGGCDALECLLRGIGIDDSEFVPGTSTSGHIHVYNGEGGRFAGAPAAGGTVGNAGELWNVSAKMAPYDAVLLSCECNEANENKGGGIGAPGARQALHDYADMGGRVIATHYHYTWMKNSPQDDWQQIANWNPDGTGGSGIHAVDTTTPQGAAFSDWLVAAKASTTPGAISLTDVTGAVGTIVPPAQPWIKSSTGTVRTFTFPTPTTGSACGQVAFSDLHVMGVGAGSTAFPTGCPAPGGLNAQQKALEFLLFELGSCK